MNVAMMNYVQNQQLLDVNSGVTREENRIAFSDVLANNIEAAALLETSAVEMALTEIVAEPMNNEQQHPLSDFFASLDELFNTIPYSLGFLTPSLLQEKEVTDLLATLPEAVRQEVLTFIQEEQPFERLIEKEEDLLKQANIVALFIGLVNVSPFEQTVSPAMTQQAKVNNVIHQLLQLTSTIPKQPFEQMVSFFQTAKNEQNSSMLIPALFAVEEKQTSLFKQLSLVANESKEKHGQLFHIPTEQKAEQAKGVQLQIGETTQPLSRAQQFVIQVGEQRTEHAMKQEFGRQFQNVIQKGILKHLNNGTSTFTIRLFPQHLGRLDIQLIQESGGIINAKITASNGLAKDLIEGQLQLLRNAFSQQQLNVERIEVNQQQNQNILTREDEQQKEQRQQQREQQKKSNEQSNEETFSTILEELSINKKV